MLSYEEIIHLINIPKLTVPSKSTLEINLSKSRVYLYSIDEKYNFFIDYTRNQKNRIKISLHCQEKETDTGLLRVDYNSGHKNPMISNDSLPDIFFDYVGIEFERNIHHIHFCIDGYKPLAWAIPLTKHEFPVKEIINEKDIEDAVFHFAKLANVESNIIIQSGLL